MSRPNAHRSRATAYIFNKHQQGQSAGEDATLDSGILRHHRLTVTGLSGANIPPDRAAAAFAQVAEHATAGMLSLLTQVYRLDDVAEARKAVSASPGAKVIVRPQAHPAAPEPGCHRHRSRGHRDRGSWSRRPRARRTQSADGLRVLMVSAMDRCSFSWDLFIEAVWFG